ncbi:MAG: 3-dehydroquinate synthase II [Thermoprotei archaeon]
MGDKALLAEAEKLGFEDFAEIGEKGVVVSGRSGSAPPNMVYTRISGGEDLKRVILETKPGSTVVVEAVDWSIIPYENLIAELHLKGAEVYSVGDPASLPILLTVMEKGVDGVVVRVASKRDLELIKNTLATLEAPRLVEAEVTEISQVGLGDRVCVDTTSILNEGEGLLVGNTSDFLFLVHNENIQTAYTEARPFRVNAGALHCYVLQRDGRTNYLSELKAGDRVLVVSKTGARVVSVGRAKIERRPLVLVRAKVGERVGSVVLQWAETIRLTDAEGKPISVTQLVKGSRVLVHLAERTGRHFGAKVDEFIIEK